MKIIQVGGISSRVPLVGVHGALSLVLALWDDFGSLGWMIIPIISLNTYQEPSLDSSKSNHHQIHIVLPLFCLVLAYSPSPLPVSTHRLAQRPQPSCGSPSRSRSRTSPR